MKRILTLALLLCGCEGVRYTPEILVAHVAGCFPDVDGTFNRGVTHALNVITRDGIAITLPIVDDFPWCSTWNYSTWWALHLREDSRHRYLIESIEAVR